VKKGECVKYFISYWPRLYKFNSENPYAAKTRKRQCIRYDKKPHHQFAVNSPPLVHYCLPNFSPLVAVVTVDSINVIR
jgi:hypothetical protein